MKMAPAKKHLLPARENLKKVAQVLFNFLFFTSCKECQLRLESEIRTPLKKTKVSLSLSGISTFSLSPFEKDNVCSKNTESSGGRRRLLSFSLSLPLCAQK